MEKFPEIPIYIATNTFHGFVADRSRMPEAYFAPHGVAPSVGLNI